MNVLITGDGESNGAVTARLLVKEGLHPVLLDNRKDLSLMGDIRDKVDCVEADVCDQQALEKLVDDYQITHIAHLAALMPEPAEANPRLGIKVGVDGTVNILEVARTKGIKRVVFTSSKAVYGEISGEQGPPTFKPVREDHPKHPVDLYGSIKVCCEEVGRYLSRGLRDRVHRFAFRVDLWPWQRSTPWSAFFLWPAHREGEGRREVGDTAGR